MAFCVSIHCVVENTIEIDMMSYFLVETSDSANYAAIEELKKQIDEIVQDLNLIKEQQALQTGIQ